MVGLPEEFEAAQLCMPDLYTRRRKYKTIVPCPCHVLGSEKAIKTAREAVEQVFYELPEKTL